MLFPCHVWGLGDEVITPGSLVWADGKQDSAGGTVRTVIRCCDVGHADGKQDTSTSNERIAYVVTVDVPGERLPRDPCPQQAGTHPATNPPVAVSGRDLLYLALPQQPWHSSHSPHQVQAMQLPPTLRRNSREIQPTMHTLRLRLVRKPFIQ